MASWSLGHAIACSLRPDHPRKARVPGSLAGLGDIDRRVVAVQAEDVDEMVRQRQQQQLVRERGRRIKAAAELGLARSSGGRQWGRALGRRALVLRKGPATAALSSSTLLETTSAGKEESKQTKELEGEAGQQQDNEEEEEVMVEEKVELLRQLVPGGEAMAVERLLDETADYIAALRAQVGVMRALACLLSGLGSPPEKPL